jgi:hypothetical protein
MARKRNEKVQQKTNTTDLVFKIIGAAGVIAGIIFGAVKLLPVEETTLITYDYDAELLATPRELIQSDTFELIQFELDGIASGYVSEVSGFGGVVEDEKVYKTYHLDPYYSQSSKSSSSNPVFNVTILNKSDNQLVISEVIYRVHRIDGVRGGDFGPLAPNVKYRHGIHWEIGDQLAKLIPPFAIAPNRAGSFLLELQSLKEDVGLVWLLEVAFLDSSGKSVTTDIFQLIMSKKPPWYPEI